MSALTDWNERARVIAEKVMGWDTLEDRRTLWWKPQVSLPQSFQILETLVFKGHTVHIESAACDTWDVALYDKNGQLVGWSYYHPFCEAVVEAAWLSTLTPAEREAATSAPNEEICGDDGES